ncbi:MAG: hypothetical protein MHM6MM_000684 [Cercozoa sp. M6MM]
MSLSPAAPTFVPETSSTSVERAEKKKRHRPRGRRRKKSPASDGAAEATPTNTETSESKPDNAKRSRNRNRKKKQPKAQSQEAKAPVIFDPSMLGGFSERARELALSLIQDAMECAVCCELVRAKHAIWTCSQCHVVLHHRCIKQWAKQSPDSQFRCPACQAEHRGVKGATCFCGRTSHKKVLQESTSALPHACTSMCRKKRGEKCPHKCPLVCHPGPCPPCTRPGAKARCPCGKSSRHVACSAPRSLPPCGQSCGQRHRHCRHVCSLPCHAGACPPCEEKVQVTCRCGRETVTVTCGDIEARKRAASCEHVCDESLSCGTHTCQLVCHAPSLHVRTVAVRPESNLRGDGLIDHSESSAADQSTCASAADLGRLIDRACVRSVHTCARAPCFPQPCAGGHVLLTQFAFRATCESPLPSCGGTCGKKLACGNHTCQATCHDGECPPCTVMTTTVCRCGRSSRRSPCGSSGSFRCQHKCTSALSCGRHKCRRRCCEGNHECTRVCHKALPCGHQCEDACHSRQCRPCGRIVRDLSCACGAQRRPGAHPCGTPPPVCRLPCQRSRECGHPCPRTCHADACPPCSLRVDRVCTGGHNVVVPNVPCRSKRVSCGQVCGKPRQCGKHTCRRTCHIGACDDAQSADASCGQQCLLRMPCGHACRLPCHPTVDTCDHTVCTDSVTLTCRCGHRRLQRPCRELGASRVLDCNDDCARSERNRRLRELFHIDHSFSHSLVNQARPHRRFILKIEEILDKVLRDFAATGTSTTVIRQRMHPDQRWILKQIAPFYNMSTSTQVSQVTNTGIEIRCTSKSRAPQKLLSQVLQDEDSTSNGTSSTGYGNTENASGGGWPTGHILEVRHEGLHTRLELQQLHTQVGTVLHGLSCRLVSPAELLLLQSDVAHSHTDSDGDRTRLLQDALTDVASIVVFDDADSFEEGHKRLNAHFSSTSQHRSPVVPRPASMRVEQLLLSSPQFDTWMCSAYEY